MVCWEAITFHYHLVVYCAVIENDFSVDEIFEFCFAFRNIHAYDVVLAVGDSFVDFIHRSAVTESVVLCFMVLLALLHLTHLLQSIGGAEAVVGMTVFYQRITKLFVDCQSL